jgi:hypothetical protein
MCARDRTNDREPETRAPLTPSATGVESHPRLEHPFPIGRRNPRSIVVNGHDDVRADPFRLRRNGFSRVPPRVREQVVDQPPQRQFVALDQQVIARSVDQRADIDGRASLWRATVESGEQQQILG